MLKFFVFSLALWHEIYGISCQVSDKITDTQPLTLDPTLFHQRNNDGRKNLDNLGRYYNINMGNLIINVNGRSLRPMGVSSFVNSEQKINSDYTETIGIGAHKLHRRKLPWKTARKICTDEHGHLAVIRSDSEEKIILQMMQEMSIDDAWLGLHDQFEEGEWISILDEPLGETGWAKWSKLISINPDNFQGNQNCARLLKNGGGMDDDNCAIAKSFVCKISSI